jgi:hypothetical protein
MLTCATLCYSEPYLGLFQVKFNNELETAQKRYFHVSGSKGPDFPSILSLPVDDVPMLRLYKPPGDQSFAYLERSWAESVQISFGREGKQFCVCLQALTNQYDRR